MSFILAQMAGTFDGKPADMRIIAAGSELQPGSEALYVMPDSRFKTVASPGKYHARVGLSTPNAWVRTHPGTVAAFLRALAEGQELADTDRAAVESAMEKYTSITPPVADNTSIDSYPLTMDLPELQRVPGSMFPYGLTPGAKSAYQIAGMGQPGLIRGLTDGPIFRDYPTSK